MIIRFPKPSKGGSNTQNRRLPGNIANTLKMVCCKYSACDNCQGEICKSFIGLTVGAKKILHGRPLFSGNLLHNGPARTFSTYFRPLHLSRNNYHN